MLLTCQPKWSTRKSLSGDLLVNSQYFCFFLTLPLGDGLPGSAIPPGRYSVTIAPSPKFQAIAEHDAWFKIYANQIPHLLGIPNRSNILIHPGNYPDNTEGCILVGNEHNIDFLGNSRTAFSRLQPMIVAATLNPLEGCELEMLSYEVNSNRDAVQAAVGGEA